MTAVTVWLDIVTGGGECQFLFIYFLYSIVELNIPPTENQINEELADVIAAPVRVLLMLLQSTCTLQAQCQEDITHLMMGDVTLQVMVAHLSHGHISTPNKC